MNEVFHEIFSFSSPFHLLWFTLSMTWLAFAIAARRRVWPAKYGCIGHAITAFDAVTTLAFLGPSQVYTVHCVWFNALMAFIHWRILVSAAPPE